MDVLVFHCKCRMTLFRLTFDKQNKTEEDTQNYLISKGKVTSNILKYLLEVSQILPKYTRPAVKPSDNCDTSKCSNAGSSNEFYPTRSTYYHLTSFSCQVHVAFFSWHFGNIFPETVLPMQAGSLELIFFPCFLSQVMFSLHNCFI